MVVTLPKNAVEYAIQLAKEVNAEVEIIYVVRYAIGAVDAGVLPIDIEVHEKELSIGLIEKIKEKHPNIKINDFETIGYPTEEINKAIQKWDADILIIGHHTHNFIERILISSVENKLLKHLHLPLLIIPENYKC
ncbi:MAG: universal stress protein [Flavobacteriales bacterium]|nr:universal stress protein [Flavobacteriales bacterium]